MGPNEIRSTRSATSSCGTSPEPVGDVSNSNVYIALVIKLKYSAFNCLEKFDGIFFLRYLLKTVHQSELLLHGS
eukprot:2431153-Ditylum_brightwellii.AAC.1